MGPVKEKVVEVIKEVPVEVIKEVPVEPTGSQTEAALAAELAALAVFAMGKEEILQDTIAVNEAVKSVQEDWDKLAEHENRTGLDYVVLDEEGKVVYRTARGLSETVNEAGGSPPGIWSFLEAQGDTAL